MIRRSIVRGRIAAALAGAGLVGAALFAGTGGAAAIPEVPRAAAQAHASITPSSNIGNEETVTVSWSGFTPTTPDPNSLSVRLKDLVGIYECVANPPGKKYFYTRDCYTQLPPDDPTYPGDGNKVDPVLDDYGLYGVTGPDGNGQTGFQVQTGTLHTGEPFNNATPIKAFNIQCDQSHPCVLKVVDFGSYFDTWTRDGVNFPGHPLTPGDWTELADAAPSVPLSFGNATSCPPPAPTTPQIDVEGAGSASYAINTWNGQLCTSRTPLNLNYTTTGEYTAASDFQSGATEVALASLAPSSGPKGGSYVAAPLDVSGVDIAFRIDDAVTGTPVTTVRLTPRLVAMLVTDSGTFGDVYADSASIYPLTLDPEFQALNPGVHFPGAFGGYGVIEPILEGAATDDTEILTQWIADDADARAFLRGADPCGAKLNANWAGVSYPTPIFRDLEQNPSFPAWSGYYNPITNLLQAVNDLFYGKPAGFNPVDSTGSAASMPPVVAVEDAMYAELDNTSTVRAAEPAASLSSASKDSTIGQYVTVTSPGHCTPKSLTSFSGFTAPTTANLATALGTMTRNRDLTMQPPVTTTVPGAYPLTKVDYAFLPSSNLTEAKAKALAQFVDYVAGPGQSGSVLPYGYTPLPAFLVNQDTTAAAAVLKSVPSTPKPGGGTGGPLPGSTSFGSTPAGSTSFGSTPSTSTSTTATSSASGGSASAATTKPVGQTAQSAPSTGAVASAATAVDARQAEGPVTVGAMERNGWWLLPLIAGLVLVMGLGGYVLGWETPLSRSKRRQGS
jgi:hypothetical protein